MDDDILEKEEGSNMGTIILMLGLYLIVLAFFILLNAISQISEEKVEQASESVAEGFGFQMNGKVRMRDNVEVTLNPVFEVISREIEDLMESHVAIQDYKMRSDANKMVLRIKTETLFPTGQVRILPDKAELFAQLANIIRAPKPGTTMVADIRVVNTPADLGLRTMDLQMLAGQRAALFVRALEERGVPPSSMSAGALTAEDGADSEIRVYFEVLVRDHKQAMAEARKIMFGENAAAEPQAGPEGSEAPYRPDIQGPPPVQLGPEEVNFGAPASTAP